MASNKNQHFVPRCYLRPFTLEGAGAAINLYNIDRQRFIEQAPVKNQCSRDYFYGKDARLEDAMQSMERAYSTALREIGEPGYALTESHRRLLKLFWLLQHLRTEAAAKRSVEMSDLTLATAGVSPASFRLEIGDAVRMAMSVFAESMQTVADLKVCLVKNRTPLPFVTSDDPAVLTNRWQLESMKTKGRSFGIQAAGAILLLPLNPRVLCLGYDGDVYSVPHEKGWVETRRGADIEAFNEHQFLNCRANIFVRDSAHSQFVHESFLRSAPRRPEKRHLVHYAVLKQRDDDYAQYEVVDLATAGDHPEALIHTQVISPVPASWPRQVTWRQRRGFAFTNGSGVGYIRRAFTNRPSDRPFRKESTQ